MRHKFLQVTSSKFLRNWLTSEHLDLVKAILYQGDLAISNWESWNKKIDFDNTYIDEISFFCLPLIYKNLVHNGYKGKDLKKLKGLYKKKWLENKITHNDIDKIISALDDNGIKFSVIGDLAVGRLLYLSNGFRRISSIDLLIHPQMIQEVLEVLENLNILSKVNRPKRFLSVESPLNFWSNNEIGLSISWRLFPTINSLENAKFFWENNQFEVDELESNTKLNFDLLFLHICIKFFEDKPKEKIFTLIDIAILIRDFKDDVNWILVRKLIRVHDLDMYVFATLKMIQELSNYSKIFEIPINLSSLNISTINKVEIWTSFQVEIKIVHVIVRYFINYFRSPLILSKIRIFRYFQYVWGGDGLLSLPSLAYKKLRLFYGKKGNN